MGHDGLVGAWLGQESRPRRQIPGRGPLPAGHDENFGIGPRPMHLVRELEAVAPDGHVHIRQKDIGGQACRQKNQRLSRIGSLDHPEAGVFQKFGDEEADERLIFDEKNRGLVGRHRLLTHCTMPDNDSKTLLFRPNTNNMKLYPIAVSAIFLFSRC
jgi:hypothetical protein